jgi:hypothetical protein
LPLATPAGSGDKVRTQPPNISNEIDIRLEKLNELWRAMEGKLLGTQPPREICCTYGHPLTDEYGDELGRHVLGIQKVGGKWRVSHATRYGNQ